MPGRAGRPETGHRIPLDPTAGAGCLLRRRRLGPREAGEAPRERTGARAMRAEPVPRLAEKLNRLRPRHQRGAGRRGATAPRTQPRRWRGGSGGVGPFAPPPPASRQRRRRARSPLGGAAARSEPRESAVPQLLPPPSCALGARLPTPRQTTRTAGRAEAAIAQRFPLEAAAGRGPGHPRGWMGEMPRDPLGQPGPSAGPPCTRQPVLSRPATWSGVFHLRSGRQ